MIVRQGNMKCQFGISCYRGDGMADQKAKEMEPMETQIVEIMPPDIENLIYVITNKLWWIVIWQCFIK